MWPRRVYTRKKRAGMRLNVTPTPELAFPARTEGPPGAKGKSKARGLRKIRETPRLSRHGESSGQASTQSGVTGAKSLQENSTGKESPGEKIAPSSESVTNDFKTDACSSDSELVSGLSLQHGSSSSQLSDTATQSDTEHKSAGEDISSFSSPELFRGPDHLDWECPKWEDYVQCKNSTLLDSSKAVAVEMAPQLASLSTILSTSSKDYKKCHRKIVKTFLDQNISPKLKCTSNSASDNAACKAVLTEKTCPPTTKSTKKKPEKDSEDRDPSAREHLDSSHLHIRAPLPLHKLTLENSARKSVSNTLLPQPPEPVLKNSSNVPGKKSKGFLTSTPSSETTDFAIDLSPVQEASFEGLFPVVSNYVNSNEIVPVSSQQENFSNELPSNTSDICCIIKLSPGTRQMKSKGVFIKKKKYPLPKGIPQDIITKTHDRT